MKVEEFRNLDQVEQYILLWEKAIVIGEREDPVYKYILYQFDSFYIELRLKRSNLNEEISAFTYDKLLEPYLHDIDLMELTGTVSS